MDCFLIKESKLSEELTAPNTSAHASTHSVDVKELLGPS